jgi:hypothetical protein
MACKGKAWFFETEDRTSLLHSVLVSNKRLRPVQNTSLHNFYIESRNLHSMPRNGTGISIAVKLLANLRFCLGMLLAVTPEEVYYFECDGHGISHLWATATWEDHASYLTFKTVKMAHLSIFCFLNQTYGSRPDGMPLTEGLINQIDGKLQCSSSGPDSFIPASVCIPHSFLLTCGHLFKESRDSSVASGLRPMMKTRSARSKNRKQRQHFPLFVDSTKKTLQHLAVGSILVEDKGRGPRINVDSAHLADFLIAVPYLCCHPIGCWFAEVSYNQLKLHLFPVSGTATPIIHDALLKQIQSSEVQLNQVDEAEYPNGLWIWVVPSCLFNTITPGIKHSNPGTLRMLVGTESGPPHKPDFHYGPSSIKVPLSQVGLVVCFTGFVAWKPTLLILTSTTCYF